MKARLPAGVGRFVGQFARTPRFDFRHPALPSLRDRNSTPESRRMSCFGNVIVVDVLHEAPKTVSRLRNEWAATGLTRLIVANRGEQPQRLRACRLPSSSR